jgi:hypothetical protein
MDGQLVDIRDAAASSQRSIIVVARGFFASFPAGIEEAAIRSAISSLGHDEVVEVAPRLGPYLAAMRKAGSAGRPAISSACPPVNAWLALNNPGLAACLVGILSPAEEALLGAAREAADAAALQDGGAELIFVSPCRAKKLAMLEFASCLSQRPEFASLTFSVIDLPPLRAEILGRLGVPGDSPLREEGAPPLPPGILFVEGEKGLQALTQGPLSGAVSAILPFWCEGGCNGRSAQ